MWKHGRGWDYIGSAGGSEYTFGLDLEADGGEFPEAPGGKFELVRANGIVSAWTIRWYAEGEHLYTEYEGRGDSPTKAYYSLLYTFEDSDSAELNAWAAAADE